MLNKYWIETQIKESQKEISIVRSKGHRHSAIANHNVTVYSYGDNFVSIIVPMKDGSDSVIDISYELLKRISHSLECDNSPSKNAIMTNV